MTWPSRATWLRIIVGVLWMTLIVWTYEILRHLGVPIRLLPHFLRTELQHAGLFAPGMLVVAYVAATVIPFPTAALAVIAGTVFGPVWGSLVALIGLNVASAVSFYIGRFFGRHFVSTHEHGWIKRLDDLMAEQGALLVLLMRLVFMPFDYVSLGSGMTRISFRQYMLGTVLGSLPNTITFVVLGDAFADPRTWIFFVILLAVTFVLAGVAFHSPWAKSHIFRKTKESPFEQT